MTEPKQKSIQFKHCTNASERIWDFYFENAETNRYTNSPNVRKINFFIESNFKGRVSTEIEISPNIS